MYTVINIGGVPEHFNLPWKLANDYGLFKKSNVDFNWQFYSAGTGAMVKALEANELDVAILLTEGAVSAIIKGLKAKIVKQYIPVINKLINKYLSAMEFMCQFELDEEFNETIKSRNAILEENCIRWGSDHIVVTQNDPSHFKALPNFFDFIIADAPCSGSGMFRKDPQAIQEWSEENVLHCSQRQSRIIEESITALQEGGYYIY